MEQPNPYQPPQPATAEIDDGQPDVITSKFLFNERHIKTLLTRFQSKAAFAKTRWFMRIGIGTSCLVLGLLFMLSAIKIKVLISSFFIFVALLIFFGNRLGVYLAVRSNRKLPSFNQSQLMRFDSSGIFAESELGKTEMTWSNFTQAIIFSDGILLLQGPKLARWVPDDSFESPEAATRLRRLVAAKVLTVHR